MDEKECYDELIKRKNTHTSIFKFRDFFIFANKILGRNLDCEKFDDRFVALIYDDVYEGFIDTLICGFYFSPEGELVFYEDIPLIALFSNLEKKNICLLDVIGYEKFIAMEWVEIENKSIL